MERNSTNSLHISILSMNFKNLTVRLYILIIFFIHVKFQEDQNQLLSYQINVKISNFYDLKLCIKKKSLLIE